MILKVHGRRMKGQRSHALTWTARILCLRPKHERRRGFARSFDDLARSNAGLDGPRSRLRLALNGTRFQSKKHTVRAYSVETPGAAFTQVDIPSPIPGAGQVLVRIHASVVNPWTPKSGSAKPSRKTTSPRSARPRHGRRCGGSRPGSRGLPRWGRSLRYGWRRRWTARNPGRDGRGRRRLARPQARIALHA